MAFSSGGGGKTKVFTEINITPLTDIFLVLMILMMVLAPTFQQNNANIKLPPIFSEGGLDDQAIMVEVMENGEMKLEGKSTSKATLADDLRALPADKKQLPVVLRADKTAKTDYVLDVFSAAAEAGFKKLTIAGEPGDAKKGAE